MTGPTRQVHLGLFLFSTGYHPAGWRLPQARPDGALDPAFLHQVAQTVERGKFDFFFLGDALATSTDMQYQFPSQMVRLEPFTMLASVAAATRNIGLVVTANTTYADPYHIARMTASLDYLSGGRVAWNIVTGADARAAFNFGRQAHWDNTKRYDYAEEFVTVVQQLWDSWEDDALPQDKATGTFVDAGKVHRIDHQGRFFSVAGPLNVARPPQGRPPLVQAGTSDRARDLGAAFADVIFTAQTDLTQAREFRRDVRERARARGRVAEQIAVLPGLVPIVGHTTEEAQLTYDTLNSLYAGDTDLGPLSEQVGADLSALALDDPLPAGTAGSPASPALQRYVAAAQAATGRSVRTVGALFDFFIASGRGHQLVVGDAVRIADVIEQWWREGAADGFNICPWYMPGGLALFVDLVVPELQRRGIFRQEYEGPTFREVLGLPRPRSMFAPQRVP